MHDRIYPPRGISIFLLPRSLWNRQRHSSLQIHVVSSGENVSTPPSKVQCSLRALQKMNINQLTLHDLSSLHSDSTWFVTLQVVKYPSLQVHVYWSVLHPARPADMVFCLCRDMYLIEGKWVREKRRSFQLLLSLTAYCWLFQLIRMRRLYSLGLSQMSGDIQRVLAFN